MKTINKLILFAGLAGGLFAAAAGFAADDSPTNTPAADAAAVAQPQTPQPPDSGTTDAPAPTPSAQDTATITNSADFPQNKGLRMNFRGVPLEQVLNYMSKAAGFIIHPKVPISGKVDAWSDNPLTKDEALDLLEHVLDDNGYTAIRDGKILTIISKVEAKKNSPLIKRFTTLDEIPKNDEVATYIIPVRTLNPIALVKNLQPLISSDNDLQANESANSLLITDSQNNIRRVAEIIEKLDSVSSSINTIKVYPLKYADAKSLVSSIKELFPSASSSTGGQGAAVGGFGRFGGGGRGGGGGGGGFPGIAGFLGGGGGGGGATDQGTTPTSRVAAVSDDHSNSLIVSAPEDLIQTIDQLVKQVDTPVEDVTVVKLFKLKNADPNEMATLLGNLFPDPSNSTDASRSGIQFGNARGGGVRVGNPFNPFFGGAQTTDTQSPYMKKMASVVAVPDSRTQSLLVSASKDLMPQIEDMITQLDESDAGKMHVRVFSLKNADPSDVQSVLRDLIPSSSTTSSSTTATSALATRAQTVQQNQLTTGAGSGTGTTTSGGRGGGGF
jgi:type II secretory pathway component GspD/PulD (secretin)